MSWCARAMRCCVLAALALGAGCVAWTPHGHAQAPPRDSPRAPAPAPAPTGAGIQSTWLPAHGGRLSLVDTTQNRVLLTAAEPLVYDGPVKAQIRFATIAGGPGLAGGCDLAIELTNPTDQALPFPPINLHRFVFTDTWIWNFAGAPRPKLWTEPVAATVAHSATYPNEWYSPAMVLGDGQHTIGVAVLYDPVATDQFIKLELQGGPHAATAPTAAGASPAGWDLRILPQGTLAAGASRQYTVTVRVLRCNAADPAGAWLATLEPYRAHFRSTFGGVGYTRDPRPVMGASLAEDTQISASNPRGFTYEHLRPDRHGYRPWADYLIQSARARGYERVMLWAVSGLYYRNRQDNYPTDIFSGLQNQPLLDTISDLRRIPAAGLTVGYWWGNSMFFRERWDAGELTRVDVDNPQHVQLAMREFDSALSMNAKMIGLDSFPRSTPAAQYRYLWAMRARAPGVCLVTEVAASDLYHALAPTWVNAEQVRGPHWLADFLLPGHETWAAVRNDVLERRQRRPMNLMDKQQALRAVAAAGFVPVDLGGVPLGAVEVRAAESWRTSMPPWLRQDPAPARAAFNPQMPMPEPQVVVPPPGP